MKKTIAIRLVNDVYELVAECSKTKFAFDVFAERDRVIVPCSSLMGMFSINPAEPFEIEIPDREDAKDFINYVSKFEI